MTRARTSLIRCGCLWLLASGCAGNNGDAPGTAGTTGSSGTAGATGTGGTGTGTAGTTGSGGTGTTANCTFTAMSSTSTKIPTVGIVTWSTTLPGVQSAQIDFGLTTSYGMTAPVDLAQASYRTLLLGMKAAQTYHFRITASGSAGQCQSEDYTIATGAAPNGLPKITVKTNDASAVYGGFLITGQYSQNAGASGSPAYILDADGDYVWWFNISSDVTGARMSYDGTHMWINGANVPSGAAHVHRVTMDGITDEDLSSKFTGLNHQLTVEPDETVAFYAYGTNGCDDIKEYSPSGTVKTIVSSQAAQKLTSGMCHVNNIEYSKSDDALVFSDLDHSAVAKVKRSDGSTIWVLNGSTSTFTGATWSGGEHGLHLIDLTHILIFNNNNSGGGGSNAIEMQLDTSAKTATKIWSYTASPAIANQVMGDVQRLPNGNTIVGYSTKGALHEVSAGGAIVQQLTWPAGASFGYIEKRATLYGPPPK